MATRPGATAAISSPATGPPGGQVGHCGSLAGAGRIRTGIIRGSIPVRRTGRGGVSSGAATASTRLATASTSAGVR